jgi:molybdopterin-binding protein
LRCGAVRRRIRIFSPIENPYIFVDTGFMADLYTPRMAAERLGISYPTIKQWLYRGKIRAIKTPGGHYRIHANDIDALLEGGAQGSKRSSSARKGAFPISGRNQLAGTVVEVRFEGLMAQVRIAIGDQFITSIITADAARELKLRPGVRAIALIKSTEVMVMRA